MTRAKRTLRGRTQGIASPMFDVDLTVDRLVTVEAQYGPDAEFRIEATASRLADAVTCPCCKHVNKSIVSGTFSGTLERWAEGRGKPTWHVWDAATGRGLGRVFPTRGEAIETVAFLAVLAAERAQTISIAAPTA